MNRSLQFVALCTAVLLLLTPAAAAIKACVSCAPPAAPAMHASMPCCPEASEAGTGDLQVHAMPQPMSCCQVSAAPVVANAIPAPAASVVPVHVAFTVQPATVAVRVKLECRLHGSPPLAVLGSFLI